MADALHIQHLVARARALGADRAAPLPARAVVVDERVRLKCRIPLCAHYGVNLMCPPHTPSPAETREALARYGDTLVVQRGIPLTQTAVDDALAGMGYAEAKAAGAAATAGGEARQQGYERTLRESQNEFAAVMTALEAEAFKLGYRFAAAYAGGDCVLCDVCVGPSGEACRHPFEARPSMEAVGIDVIATADAAGIPVEMPAADHPAWTGLLLID
ncbi:MAG: DUF2284 domain-containing protein [Thermoleophilia bacterium]